MMPPRLAPPAAVTILPMLVLLAACCREPVTAPAAAAPAAAAPAPATVPAPTTVPAPAAWPREDGLLFAYASRQDIYAFDEDGTRKRGYAVVPSDLRANGLTAPDRAGGLALVRGSYRAQGLMPHLLPRLLAATAVSIQACVTADGSSAAPAVIAALAGPDGTDLALVQVGDEVQVEVRADPPVRVPIGRIGSGPVHLMASFSAGGAVRTWRDGVAGPAATVPVAALPQQEKRTVWLGDDPTGSRPWRGVLHSAALHARAADDAEAAAAAAACRARTAAAAPVAATTVEAVLVAASTVPDPQSIQPYYRALVACSYDVRRVISGPAIPARITVMHWGVMGGRKLALAEAAPGAVHTLVLEPFAAHAHLAPDFLNNGLDEQAAEDPVFYDIGLWSLRASAGP